jgi:hypothetical protein
MREVYKDRENYINIERERQGKGEGNKIENGG